MRYCIDTNILILLLAGDRDIGALLEEVLKSGNGFIIPAVVITEFYSKEISTEQTLLLKSFFGEATSVIPIDYPIARLAGDLRSKHSKLRLGDSLVAATAIVTKSILVTKNMQDFRFIENVKMV